MAGKWQIKQGEKVLGPFSQIQLQKLASTGRLNRRTPIRPDGNAIWMPAGRIPGLFPEAEEKDSPPQEFASVKVPNTDSATQQSRSTVNSNEIWYVGRNGESFGPFSFEEIEKHSRAGELLSTDLVWKTGQKEWVAASTIISQINELHALQNPPPLPIITTSTKRDRTAGKEEANEKTRVNSGGLFTIAIVLFLCGAAGTLHYFSMDTSVPLYPQAPNLHRVHNIGLMQDRIVGLIVSILVCVVGLLLGVFSRMPRPKH